MPPFNDNKKALAALEPFEELAPSNSFHTSKYHRYSSEWLRTVFSTVISYIFEIQNLAGETYTALDERCGRLCRFVYDMILCGDHRSKDRRRYITLHSRQQLEFRLSIHTMVQQGDFSVHLVDAETLHPFQEHSTFSNGTHRHYVEVEPNAEYFIQVQSHRPSEHDQSFLCTFEVDSHDLGIQKRLHGQRISYAGIWNRTGLTSTFRALQVKTADQTTKSSPSDNNNNNESDDHFWIGSVQVQFYEAIVKGVETVKDHKSLWKAAKASSCSIKGKKAVASSSGTKIREKKIHKRRRTRYSPGKLLETVTLNYCTASGLIHAGVLPKPSLWEDHRARYPASNAPESEVDESEVIVDQVRSLAEILEERSQQTLDLTPLHHGELRDVVDADDTEAIVLDNLGDGNIAAETLPECVKS
jgi:hypothetical protein